ncbi:MAG: arylsulfatase [Promethearchaeota archaeon]|nr:MAG: arylsulfatase [Candidatus Lokiarchaeota archaeon]
MDKPNIVFVFTDQQRFDTCGCYGQKLDITPNLDKMAKEGVLFQHAFTNQPVCGPARSIIQTGKYATETMCYRNGIALPLNEKTIADYLSEAGYSVAYIGKWHLASTILKSKENVGPKVDYTITAVPPERRGGYKDYWLASDVLEYTSHPNEGHLFNQNMEKVEFSGYRVDCLTNFALDFLDNYEEQKPFFLFISFLEPHQQNDIQKIVGPEGSKEKFKVYDVPKDLVNTEGDWKEFFPDYLGCCNRIDSNLKRITDKIDDLGISDNTVFIFVSDHGCHFRTRTWEYKRSCHDSSIRVPLVIKGPGFMGGKKVNELVSLINLAPTILGIAGVPIPDHMSGKKLQELIENPNLYWNDEIFIQISESQVGRALRTEKWKFSMNAPKKSGFWHAFSNTYVGQYLYDLETDPYERTNLIHLPEYNEIKSKLAERLVERMVEIREPRPDIKI